MLTIFTTAKPFRGHIGVIQTNAIQSWLSLRPECEVILFGNEEGAVEVASRFGIRHIAEVECSEHGTPLISSMFRAAQDVAQYQLMCYINADIILLGDFLPAIRQIQMPSFLIVGQRWDVDLTEPLDFTKPDWEAHLRARITGEGKLHPKSGIDYFVFPSGLYEDIPPFAIGRGGWDNWLIYRARLLKVPVIDATKAITAVHQNHDYSHIPTGETGVWKGPESLRNLELARGGEYAFTLEYVTWLLIPQGLRRALTMRNIYFRMRAIPMLYPYLHFLVVPFKVFEKWLRVLRRNKGTA